MLINFGLYLGCFEYVLCETQNCFSCQSSWLCSDCKFSLVFSNNGSGFQSFCLVCVYPMHVTLTGSCETGMQFTSSWVPKALLHFIMYFPHMYHSEVSQFLCWFIDKVRISLSLPISPLCFYQYFPVSKSFYFLSSSEDLLLHSFSHEKGRFWREVVRWKKKERKIMGVSHKHFGPQDPFLTPLAWQKV